MKENKQRMNKKKKVEKEKSGNKWGKKSSRLLHQARILYCLFVCSLPDSFVSIKFVTFIPFKWKREIYCFLFRARTYSHTMSELNCK